MYYYTKLAFIFNISYILVYYRLNKLLSTNINYLDFISNILISKFKALKAYTKE